MELRLLVCVAAYAGASATLDWAAGASCGADGACPAGRPGAPDEEFSEAMRVDMLQRGRQMVERRLYKRRLNPYPMTLVKSTLAVSKQRIEGLLTWKLEALPVQRDDEKISHACGYSARTSLIDSAGGDLFHLHGVYGEGSNKDRDFLEGLSVFDVEKTITTELGNMSTYSPWMDQHFAFYDNNIGKYVHALHTLGTNFLTVGWKIAWKGHQQQFYSVIAQGAESQEIYEIVSAEVPTKVDYHHTLPRHFFTRREAEYLMRESSGPVPLNVARHARNLTTVKAFYREMFELEPLAEGFDEAERVGYVFFSHDAEGDPVSRQVHYWYRGNQALSHLEEQMEAINSKYLTNDLKSCWPIWGDNHYTIRPTLHGTTGLVERLWAKYDARGWGYKIFADSVTSDQHMTTYFPAPGGAYIEVQEGVSLGGRKAEQWVVATTATYCYNFTCAA